MDVLSSIGLSAIEAWTRVLSEALIQGGRARGLELMGLEDPKPLENEIREKVTAAKEGGGYVYHSDHSVPNTVSFAQYKRVMELISKYGGYKR